MAESIERKLTGVEESATTSDQRAVVSQRKLNANRGNALKSTGPKTARGKAHSRRNAIKHGLFASSTMNFFFQSENSQEYEELRKDLRNQYKPVGRSEELEVERLVQCWWRHQRAWRFENAMKRVASRDVASKELSYQGEWCKALDTKDREFTQQLDKLSDEIESAGEVPADLKERLIAIRPDFQPLWSLIEAATEPIMTRPCFSGIVGDLSPEERPVAVAVTMIILAIGTVRELGRIRSANITEVAHDQHAIPKGDALDRLLRYEAANDRNLNRALDRLERLQRCRKGEPVLPPVRVRVTRES